jgi:hypothetical protein
MNKVDHTVYCKSSSLGYDVSYTVTVPIKELKKKIRFKNVQHDNLQNHSINIF